MTPFTSVPRTIEAALERRGATCRDFLKTSGLMVVSFGAATIPGARHLAAAGAVNAAGAQTSGPYPDPDFRQLDSWIAIHGDNTATFYVGKTDCGQGTGTAFRQMMSDELDIAYENTSLIMGSTDVTPDQGGSGGSDGIQRDGWPMRRVAAEARRVLLELAAERFGVPVEQLAVSEAVITSTTDASRMVTYAELIGRPVRMQWMRDEATAWDTKGPAYTFRLRGGLDAQGTLVALDYDARSVDYNHLGYNEVETVLISQLMGTRRATPNSGRARTPSDELYAIPNRRRTAQVVRLPAVWETPLRTGNLRDPGGPQVTFASESFIDELAAADPL